MRFFLIIIFVIGNLHAFEVHRESGNRIVMWATEGCDEISKLLPDLRKWTKNSADHIECPKDIEVKMVGSFCTADITDCVPLHIKKYQDKIADNAGPNCWNLALVFKEILPGLRYTTPEEMNFYMAPPLCRALKNGEARQSGDIGTIKTKKKGNLEAFHGFIYVSEQMVYSKNGYERTGLYSLQDYSKMLSLYKVPETLHCREENQTNEATCSNPLSFYRCISMEEYLEKLDSTPSIISKSLNALVSFEKCTLQETTMRNIPLDEKQKANVEDILLTLSEYVEKEKTSNKKFSEEDMFLLKSIQLQVAGIKEQFEYNDPSDPTFRGLKRVLDDAIRDLP